MPTMNASDLHCRLLKFLRPVNVPVQTFEGTRSAFVSRNNRLDFQAALAILFTVGLMPASLHAQSAASVNGTVTDMSGAAPSAIVQAARVLKGRKK